MTAVEYLEEKWNNYPLKIDKSNFILFINQAKEIEKKQISKAYVYGAAYGIDIEKGIGPIMYYNETYIMNKL